MKTFYSYLLVFLNMQLLQASQLQLKKNIPSWCWTRPNLDAKVKEGVFGINWAVCEGYKPLKEGEEYPDEEGGSAGSSESMPKVNYEIKVTIGETPGFNGKKGPYYIKINSDEIEGQEMVLITEPFIVNSVYKTSIEVESVGQISNISIRQADDDDGPFTCEKIEVIQGASEWNFDCNNILDKDNKYMNIDLDDQEDFEVTVTSEKEESKQATVPIAVSIQGENGQTNFVLLSELPIGSKVEPQKLKFKDVGEPLCIIFKAYERCGFQPVNVDVLWKKQQGDQKFEFKNMKKDAIEYPNRRELALCKGPSGGSQRPADVKEFPAMNRGSQLQKDDLGLNSKPSPPCTNFRNGLNADEEENIREIDCNITAEKIFDGAKYFSLQVNYEIQFVICPPNCHKNASTVGRSIYSPKSAVCPAGIMDGSIPRSGGLFGIVRTAGQDDFGQYKKVNGIAANSGNGSTWSFHTIKINNPDFAKSDLRIVDNNGEPNFIGRVEFRVGGKWGTVNYEGTTAAFARHVCRSLNYKDGTLLNNKKDFCTDFKGKDWCGYEGEPVHYSQYICAETDNSIMDCTRQAPGSFSHEGDVLVECSDIDKKNSDDIKPKDGTIRLVGSSGSPSVGKQGRVEIFKEGRYGGICNKGWNNIAAKIACVQMGYDDGSIIGKSGEFKTCVIDGENFCVNASKDYALSDVSCKPDAKKLIDCGSSDKLDCSEEMTAMLKCEGNGDNSGNSQKDNENADTKKPLLGQLPLANPYFMDCTTQIDDFLFQGDPGSIYVGKCPSGCADDTNVIHGNGIYDETSYICKAAIHAGVLDNRGGFVTVKINFAHKSFNEAVNRGIGSVKKGWSKKTFVVSRTLDWHKKLSVENYQPPVVGLVAPYSKAHNNGLSKIQNPTAFLQLSTRTLDEQNSIFAKKFRDYLQRKSFLAMSLKAVDPPVFSWASPNDYKFNEQEVLNTKGLEKSNDLKELQSLTIMVKFVVDDQITGSDGKPILVEVLGHSECQCWGLVIDYEGISFGKKCEQYQMFPMGYYPQQGKNIHMAVTYNAKEKKLSFYKKGEGLLAQEENVTFNFQCQGIINIGQNVFSNSNKLIGKIAFVQVWNMALTSGQVIELFGKPDIKPTMTANQVQENGGPGKPVLKSTADERKCVSPCSKDPIPPDPKAPEPPEEAKIGQAPQDDDADSTISDDPDSPDFVPHKEDDGQENKNEGPSTTALQLKCSDTLEFLKLQGFPGKGFRCYCPKECSKTEKFIFGSQVYHPYTSICKAAIHDGKITDDGGEFILTLTKLPHLFHGTNNNQLQSDTLQVEPGQTDFLAFAVEKAPAVLDIECDTLGGSQIFGEQIGMKAYICPKNCSRVPNKVFGVKYYHTISSVCQAAIHAGIMTDNGGQGSLMYEKAMADYDGDTQKGITSARYFNKDKSGNTFVVIGDKMDTTGYFIEDYKAEQVDENYSIDDHERANKGPSKWFFNIFPFDPKGERMIIQNNSEIEIVDVQGEFASKLIRKEFDSANGMLKVNIFFEAIQQAAIYFRHYDENNYYVIKMNVPKQKKIELYKKVAGFESLIESYNEPFLEMVWYRFFIVFHDDQIQLYKQTVILQKQGDIRQIDQIFDLVDKDVQRGKVAIATNGNSKATYWDGFQVTDYDPLVGIIDFKYTNHRDYPSCLLPASKSKRQKFFEDRNHIKKDAGHKNILINYCADCCSTYVETWEKLIHYNCVKSCVSVSRNYEKELRDKFNRPQKVVWIPKKDELVDFQPEGKKDYIPAEVVTVEVNKEDSNILEIQVRYATANGNFEFLFYFSTVQLDFPSPRLQKCGQEIESRTDCNS